MTKAVDTRDKLGKIETLLNTEKSRRKALVDFDYTLYLSNSTEEFLGSAKPAFLAVFILKALAAIKPWLLLSKDEGYFLWRDTIRVWSIIILMPWTLFLFKRKAPKLFSQYLNQDLARSLNGTSNDNLIIISFGFSFIIKQLIVDSPFAKAKLIASSIWHPSELRKQGKLAYLSKNSLGTNPEQDVVITDSEKDDADLLATYKNSFYIRWPNEKTEGAHAGVYIPFYYLATIKRTPEFFIKSTLLEEFPIFILAFLIFQPFHWGTLIGSLLLFLTFLIVYEIGYRENDHIGAKYEKAPKLTDAFFKNQSYQVEPYAWYWFIAITTIAILIFDLEDIILSLHHINIPDVLIANYGELILIGLWTLMAILVRLIFSVFNHVPLAWRVFTFLPLHIVKYFAPLIIFSLQPSGLALLSAQVIRTWAAYAIRRCDGDVELISSQFIRLIFLVFLLCVFSLVTSYGDVFSAWQTWVILAWCTARTLPEMKRKLLSKEVLAEFIPWSGKDSEPKK